MEILRGKKKRTPLKKLGSGVLTPQKRLILEVVRTSFYSVTIEQFYLRKKQTSENPYAKKLNSKII